VALRSRPGSLGVESRLGGEVAEHAVPAAAAFATGRIEVGQDRIGLYRRAAFSSLTKSLASFEEEVGFFGGGVKLRWCWHLGQESVRDRWGRAVALHQFGERCFSCGLHTLEFATGADLRSLSQSLAPGQGSVLGQRIAPAESGPLWASLQQGERSPTWATVGLGNVQIGITAPPFPASKGLRGGFSMLLTLPHLDAAVKKNRRRMAQAAASARSP